MSLHYHQKVKNVIFEKLVTIKFMVVNKYMHRTRNSNWKKNYQLNINMSKSFIQQFLKCFLSNLQSTHISHLFSYFIIAFDHGLPPPLRTKFGHSFGTGFLEGTPKTSHLFNCLWCCRLYYAMWDSSSYLWVPSMSHFATAKLIC